MSSTSFRNNVWRYWRREGRHELPWRKTHDPYKILVSEVMLQQTQVERVLPYYAEFMRRWPTAQALAKAPLASVLRAWQGLGYNRRAKMLHAAAKAIIAKHGGRFPKSVEELEALPGVGPYTARAVAAFAYNQDVVFVETNIRTALMHYFFARKGARGSLIYQTKVSDAQIAKILEQVLPKGRAREWYAALMDYGAHLKRSGIKLNTKSKHYTRQSKFAGSGREARGAILKELAKGSRSEARLLRLLGDDRRRQLAAALAALRAEGLVTKGKRGGAFALPR